MKGPPQGPRLHIDIPRVQLLIEDKEGIKQLGKHRQSCHPLLPQRAGCHACTDCGPAGASLGRERPELQLPPAGDDKATIPVTDTEFSQAVNPQSFCTGVSLHHPALIQNTGPLIDMSDIRPGTSE